MPKNFYYTLILSLNFSFAIGNKACFCQDGVGSLTVVYNNNLPPSSQPMVLPNVNNAPGGVIVIVPPDYKFDRNSLNFPEIPPLSLNVKEIKLSYNNISSSSTGSNAAEVVRENANSKFINGKVLHDIAKDLAIKAGCELTAKISIDALQKWGMANCFIPEPTNVTKVACAVGLALKDKAINGHSKKGVVKGCTYVVKDVAPKVVEVSVKMKKDAENYLQELKYWISFLNTIEGAQWFMYKLQGNN